MSSGYSRLIGEDEAGEGQPHSASLKSGILAYSAPLDGDGPPSETASLASSSFRGFDLD
jgi:hypothetical protein